MISVSRTGDWAKAARILGTGPIRIRVAIDRAVLQEAQFFRSKVIQGFVSQSPGGKDFKPLKETTLAIRRFRGFTGTKALIVRGDLRNSIKVTKKSTILGAEAFVGVHRTERGKNGESLVNIAAVHEFGHGPIVIPVTPAMRKFLMAAFSAELPGFGDAEGDGSGGMSRGIIIINIPARPFLQPVADKFFDGPIAAARFQARVATFLGGTFGGKRGAPGVTSFGKALRDSVKLRGPKGPALRDPLTGKFKARK